MASMSLKFLHAVLKSITLLVLAFPEVPPKAVVGQIQDFWAKGVKCKGQAGHACPQQGDIGERCKLPRAWGFRPELTIKVTKYTCSIIA